MIEIDSVSKFNEIMTSTKDLILIVFILFQDNKYYDYDFNIQIKQIEQKYKDLKILSVDINDNSEITNAYGITNVPTTVFYKDNNKACNNIIGYNKINEIEDIIKKIIVK